jgi:hypothetical protein
MKLKVAIVICVKVDRTKVDRDNFRYIQTDNFVENP